MKKNNISIYSNCIYFFTCDIQTNLDTLSYLAILTIHHKLCHDPLALGKCGWDFPRCNFKLLLMIYILSISCETLRRMWQDLLDEVGIGSGKGLVPSGNKPSPELTWYKSSKNISKLHIFLTVNFPNPRTNELNFCYWLRNAVVLSYQFIHPNAIFVTFPFTHDHMIQV